MPENKHHFLAIIESGQEMVLEFGT